MRETLLQPIRERPPKQPHGAPARPRAIATTCARANATSNAAAASATSTSTATATARPASAAIDGSPHGGAEPRASRARRTRSASRDEAPARAFPAAAASSTAQRTNRRRPTSVKRGVRIRADAAVRPARRRHSCGSGAPRRPLGRGAPDRRLRAGRPHRRAQGAGRRLHAWKRVRRDRGRRTGCGGSGRSTASTCGSFPTRTRTDTVLPERAGNARGVDLNRNFPHRWKRHRTAPTTPGPRPASEPETRALMRLIRRLRPTVTIWFHQHLNMVVLTRGNLGLQRRFARLAGLRAGYIPAYPGTATGWSNATFPGTTAFVGRTARRQPYREGSSASRPRRAQRRRCRQLEAVQQVRLDRLVLALHLQRR